MKKAKCRQTYVYEMGNGWLIEIYGSVDKQNDISVWEAWLGYETIGVKQFMFGVEKKTETLESFKEMAFDSFDEFKEIFREDYMQGGPEYDA